MPRPQSAASGVLDNARSKLELRMMNFRIATVWLVGCLTILTGQEKAPVAYEMPPVIEVANQLPEEILIGPHLRVRSLGQSDGYLNHYIIDSDYGVFECVGRRELELRVREIDAISKLVEVSKSDLFAEGLRRSIVKSIDAVRNILDSPVDSVKAAPKAVGHFSQKVGTSVENTAKLDTARQLGVDPYLDNVRLQEEMEKVTSPSSLAACL